MGLSKEENDKLEDWLLNSATEEELNRIANGEDFNS